jgi:hypothetical protein
METEFHPKARRKLKKADNVEEYLPDAFRATNIRIGQLRDLAQPISQTTVIRSARLLNIKGKPSSLYKLEFEGLPSPVLANPKSVMIFGDERVTIEDYIRRVVEKNDFLDLIAETNKFPQVSYLWVHIEYLEKRPADLKFKEKDAGLFGMRTKSGEKAERRVARNLVASYGHYYPPKLLEGVGVFQITYTGKKKRKPDIVCTACKLHVEVKKRNRDQKFRISHSTGRPFQRENMPDGWHAFVFPDTSIHYLSNGAILNLMNEGHYTVGHDQYDAWADLNADMVKEETPPRCKSTADISPIGHYS